MWKRRCKHNRALSFPVVRVRRARPERISRVDLHSTKHKSLGFREHDVRRALLLPWEDVHRSYERIRRGARETHAKNECGGRTKAMQTKDRIDFASYIILSRFIKFLPQKASSVELLRSQSVDSKCLEPTGLHFAYAGPRPHRQVWQELCNTESLKEISKKCRNCLSPRQSNHLRLQENQQVCKSLISETRPLSNYRYKQGAACRVPCRVPTSKYQSRLGSSKSQSRPFHQGWKSLNHRGVLHCRCNRFQSAGGVLITLLVEEVEDFRFNQNACHIP